MKIEWGKGAPYFQNPNIQKITPMEHGNWFAFKEDVDLNVTEPELLFQDKRVAKFKKVLKIVLAVIGIAIIVYFGYLFFQEWYR